MSAMLVKYMCHLSGYSRKASWAALITHVAFCRAAEKIQHWACMHTLIRMHSCTYSHTHNSFCSVTALLTAAEDAWLSVWLVWQARWAQHGTHCKAPGNTPERTLVSMKARYDTHGCTKMGYYTFTNKLYSDSFIEMCCPSIISAILCVCFHTACCYPLSENKVLLKEAFVNYIVQSLHHFNLDWNISKTIGCSAMELGGDVRGSQMMNYNDFDILCLM